jgi:glycosyltransferase involved in cell wall biosynthesis
MEKRPLEVWHPVNPADHPYLTQLCENLKREGVQVEGTRQQGRIFLKTLAGHAPPIVHFHWMNTFFLPEGPFGASLYPWVRSHGFVATLEALKRVGTNIVWTAHNLVNHERRAISADRRCHRATARRADAIIAHSPSAKEKLIETFGLQPQKVSVIPHGHFIDWYPSSVRPSDARDALGIPSDRSVFGFFGQIRRYKQVTELVRTYLRDISQDHTHLLVAGNPRTDALESELRSMADDAPDVDLHLDFVPKDEVQYYFKAADVMVFPYDSILTSGSIILSMSMARPVVAPRFGGIEDVVGADHGWLYDVGSSDGLADAMQRALSAADRLEAMGRDARKRARRWDWESIGAKTRALYDRLLEG